MVCLASTPLSAPSENSKSMLHKMLHRYFAVPQVEKWLMSRQRRLARTTHALNTSLSYACMYYAPSVVPQGVDRYPLPKPFLDFGDVLLCHHVYDGIAVGTLFNSEEEHALTIARDFYLRNRSSLQSRRPRTRNFAVDLRVKQLEIVEFAWMEDDSLVIACRRFVDARSAERRFVLSADFRFFGPIPPGSPLDTSYLVFAMKLREKTVVCEFCGAQGYQQCRCPNALKRKSPNRCSSPFDVIVPLPERRSEPTGSCASAIGSWENYTRTVFSCSQIGSFFITACRRSKNGEMRKLKDANHPIPYQFICGQPHETLNLVRRYVCKTKMCAREPGMDTFLYGGGFSRRSDIAMLMDKQDDTPQQRIDEFQTSECETMFKEDDVLSNSISAPNTTCAVLSQTTASQVTLPCDEYGQMLTEIDMSTMPPITSQCTDEGSLLSTRLSHDSPTSTLLDRNEPLTEPSFIDVHDSRSDRSHQIIDNAYNEWCPSQVTHPTVVGRSQQPPRPLSTRSRELQEYMTVDVSGTPTCAKCGSSFHKRGNLARHVQTVHLKMKPFQCDQCPAKFGYKTHLKRHMTVHQRGNEFRCTVCNRDFRGELKLKRHLQQAHQDQVELPENDDKILCDICGVSFSQRSNLSRHMQIHKGLRFFCPVCPNRLSSFGQKYDLQRHIQRKHPEYSEVMASSLVPEKAEVLG